MAVIDSDIRRDAVRRKLILPVVAAALVLAVALAGCGGTEKAEETGTTGEEQTTMPQSSSPTKTLADFPNDQDGASVQAVIKTDRGNIVFDLYPDVAPITCASFLNLARSGFYNGTRFHRVVPGFVIQGGDPKSKDPNAPDAGTGGPGYNLPAEFSARKHETGAVAMARSSDPNSAGSQFYICLGPQPNLDGQYTVFGQVVSGQEVVNAITQGDVINEIVIQPKAQ